MSLYATCDTEDGIDKIFEKLSKGSRILQLDAIIDLNLKLSLYI